MVEEPTHYTSDQSTFDASQAVLQAPPLPPNRLTEKQKQRRIFILIAILIFLVSIGILMSSPRKKIVQMTASPTPQPTSAVSVSEMQQVIDRVSQDVIHSNLEEVLLPPPQVDMKVEF